MENGSFASAHSLCQALAHTFSSVAIGERAYNNRGFWCNCGLTAASTTFHVTNCSLRASSPNVRAQRRRENGANAFFDERVRPNARQQKPARMSYVTALEKILGSDTIIGAGPGGHRASRGFRE